MRRNPKLAGFFVILFAILWITLAGRDLYRDWRFDGTPLRSTAIIERTWVTYGNKGSTHYHAAYHYKRRPNFRIAENLIHRIVSL